MSETSSPFLQHHFTEMEQQVDTGKLGMWLFLVTEVLLFGGLFVGYALMAARHPAGFHAGHLHLDRVLGTFNTVVLLTSSFTMVMAVLSARDSRRKGVIVFLILTLILAGLFLGVKYFEYSHKFREGLLPGKYYTHPGQDARGESMFFSFYFMMTGLHGVHILAGMGVMLWILLRARRGDFSSSYWAPVDLAGLYWHLVDIIWIYLFPLLYLIG